MEASAPRRGLRPRPGAPLWWTRDASVEDSPRCLRRSVARCRRWNPRWIPSIWRFSAGFSAARRRSKRLETKAVLVWSGVSFSDSALKKAWETPRGGMCQPQDHLRTIFVITYPHRADHLRHHLPDFRKMLAGRGARVGDWAGGALRRHVPVCAVVKGKVLFCFGQSLLPARPHVDSPL